jgi:hypothetical protein
MDQAVGRAPYRNRANGTSTEGPTLPPLVHSTGALPQLSGRIRNLIHVEPLVRLSLDRNSVVQDQPGLFEGVDLYYAALALLLFLMERRTVDLGASRTDILEYMSQVVLAMRPDMPLTVARRAGEIVFEALANGRNQHQAFQRDYFERDRGMLVHDFRLINVLPHDDGRILYTATEDAIILLLESLNVSPEIAQKAEEMMLKYLVESGRLAESIDLAERARMRSIQYQQFIRDKIFETRRIPEEVRWSRDVVPELKAAAAHIQERQQQERAILDAVFSNKVHATPDTLEHILRLQQIIEDCRARHSTLHQEIINAADEFLESQVRVFRIGRHVVQHDLEAQTLNALLNLPLASVAAFADAIISLISPPTLRAFVYFPTILCDLVESLGQSGSPPTEEEPCDALLPPKEHFSAELIAEVQSEISALIESRSSIDIESILAALISENKDHQYRRCAMFLCMQAYHPDTNPFDCIVRPDSSGRFTFDVAIGDRLVFEQNLPNE